VLEEGTRTGSGVSRRQLSFEKIERIQVARPGIKIKSKRFVCGQFYMRSVCEVPGFTENEDVLVRGIAFIPGKERKPKVRVGMRAVYPQEGGVTNLSSNQCYVQVEIKKSRQPPVVEMWWHRVN
jgi:hypothetical protein